MSSNYAGTNTLHGQITIPSDGDPAIAESVNTALRNLMDNSVYANTELASKLDIRGGTFTLSGNVVVQGSPNWYQNVDTFFGDDTTFGATGALNDHTVVAYDELRTFGDANLRGDARIGSGTSQTLDIRSTTSVFGPIQTFADTTLGNSSADPVVIEGTLTANAPATFNDDVDAQAQLTADSLVVSNACTVQGQFSGQGNCNLGTSSTDSHIVRGPITLHGDVTLQSADLEVGGDLDVTGNAVLGSASGDSVTIPATLVVNGPMSLFGALGNALTYTGFGRVPGKSGLINASTTVNVGSGNLFVMSAAATVTITMSDTGATNGDWMLFLKSSAAASGTLVVAAPDGSVFANFPVGSEGCALAIRAGGSWYGIELV